MNELRVLHEQAMSFAAEAALEQAAGNASRARELYAAAFKMERQAAELLDSRMDLEPTRSVLYRSAASLALDCGESRDAEKLIARALSGNPPPEIAEELRDLLESVYFCRHLDLRGVVLGPREFQMSIDGGAVGHGVARSEVFLSRVQDLESLLYRTAERKANRPFREGGRRNAALARDMGLYLSVPRAASFAVTFRIGYSTQMFIPGMDLAESVVAELLDCIDIMESGELQDLEKRIPDPSYHRNFIALARRIAPDGEAVRTVGFTADVGGIQRRAVLRRTVTDLLLSAALPETHSQERVTLCGTLRFADSLRKTGGSRIKVIDAEGKTHQVIVPEGMMSDIVRPLWDLPVRVVGTRKPNGEILLNEITKSLESDDNF